MKYCLAIETTSTHLGLSLYAFSLIQNRFLRKQTYFSPTHRRQSDLLIPTVRRLLNKEKISKDMLALIAADVGPGSFTGVRVGVAAARAIAQGLRLPLVGVKSLEAFAYEEAKKINFRSQLIAVVIPALIGEVYGAIYKVELEHSTTLLGGHLKEVYPPCWLSLKAFSSILKKRRLNMPPMKLNGPHPDAVAEIALARFFRNSNSSLFHYSKMNPFYLQPSWAERSHVGKNF